jgi:Notch-like protein
MPDILVSICLIILVISVILLYFLFFKKEKYSPHNLLNKQCNNTGYFVDSKNTCVCIDGWSGKNCTISDCNNNGKIVTDGGISKCVCNPGYNGDHCQYSDAITCNGNGTVDNKGKCTCVAGKHGKFCTNNCLYGNIVDDKCICNT